MFEEEAEENKPPYACCSFNTGCELWEDGFQRGAEFVYNKANEELEEKYKETFCNLEMNLNSVTERLEELNKANEWNYVSEKGTPKTEGHYLVCLRNKAKDVLDCWIYYDKDVGWYSMQTRIKDIYAWKEIVLPKESKEK